MSNSDEPQTQVHRINKCCKDFFFYLNSIPKIIVLIHFHIRTSYNNEIDTTFVASMNLNWLLIQIKHVLASHAHSWFRGTDTKWKIANAKLNVNAI